jgi:hypothetical protein
MLLSLMSVDWMSCGPSRQKNVYEEKFFRENFW